MKVAMDLRRNTWAPEYGISRYGRSLYRAVQAIPDSGIELRAIDIGGADTWPAEERIAVRPGHGMGTRMKQEQLDMRRLLADVDLVHLPWYEGPVAMPAPFVFNLFDLDTLVGRATYRWRFRAYYNTLLRVYVRRARRIITTSEASAAAIRERWPRATIDVIPCGVDPVFNAEGAAPAALPHSPFVFYPGGYGPRKRIDDLLAAFAGLHRADPSLRLVMTGSPPPEVRQKITAAVGDDAVLTTGYIDDVEMAAWYRNATVVAYPSLLEGFGLPIVEAFASGAPLVATDAGSIPEVAGGAATLVPVGDVTALQSALGRLLASADARTEQIELGLRRAESFQWSTVAEQTLASYRAALA